MNIAKTAYTKFVMPLLATIALFLPLGASAPEVAIAVAPYRVARRAQISIPLDTEDALAPQEMDNFEETATQSWLTKWTEHCTTDERNSREKRSTEKVYELLTAGLAVDNPFTMLMTALFMQDDLASIQLALENNGLNVDARDPFGRTALHHICALEHTSNKNLAFDMALVKLLLNANALVNAVDHDGNTPLHVACYLQKASIIYVLLSNRADVNAINRWQETPLHKFARHVQRQLRTRHDLEELTRCYSVIFDTEGNADKPESDQRNKVACDAVYPDNLPLLRVLLDAGANINTMDAAGNTPFRILCSHPEVTKNILKLALNHAYNLDAHATVNTANKDGITPLMAFCRWGPGRNKKLDRHAYPWVLYCPFEPRYLPMIDWDSDEYQERRAMDCALWHGGDGINLLLKYDKRVDTTNAYGWSAYDVAHPLIKELLKSSSCSIM